MLVRGGTVRSMSVQRDVAETPASDLQRLEGVGFMTCMTLVFLGNYAQTGHFGGPLAYTPFNVATHLAGPDRARVRFDYRRPEHPLRDKFMLAAGDGVPERYRLWEDIDRG